LAAFPLVLVCLAFAAELLLFFKACPNLASCRSTFLWLAMAAVSAAFFSGYQANDLANQTFIVPDEAIAQHHNLGRILLFCIIPCALLGIFSDKAQHARQAFRAAYLILLSVCLVLVLCTGYLGGKLVFNYGAAVSAVPAAAK